MNHFNRFFLYGSILYCFSIIAGANEIQDINKLFKQNQHVQALKRVDTYLTSKPKDAQARFLKGLILTAQNKTNDAIGIFSSLTEDYPELPEPYNNLAVLYAGLGQYDKARGALETAIRNHPNYATAQENLGDIYAKMASQAYERTLQLDRNNTATQTKLALINNLFPKGKAAAPVIGATKQPASTPGTVSAPARAASSESESTSPGKPQTAIPGTTSTPSKAITFGPESASPNKLANVKKPAASNNADALKTLREWADVWSSQNIKQYLAFYAADFKTPNGENRDDWETTSKARISTPKYIEIDISNEKVSFPDENHAIITFHQSYRSDYLNTSFDKFMLLVKINDKWFIQEERAVK